MVDGSFTNHASVVDANFEACIWRTNCMVNGSFTKSASVVDAIFEANMENKNKQQRYDDCQQPSASNLIELYNVQGVVVIDMLNPMKRSCT